MIVLCRAGCLNDPCAVNNPCGENAICENNGQRPTCSCPDGHAGDPYVRCVRGDCIANEDCNVDQACKDFRCVDPCSFSCGNGADCTPRNHVAICRCPRGRTGDPFQVCIRDHPNTYRKRVCHHSFYFDFPINL